ncbi:MAG: hypothetical protein KA715_14330 [Xanthomonadaceae bacterium]|nr:hypothetical protein [Xanthomonadaceae bacterium]
MYGHRNPLKPYLARVLSKEDKVLFSEAVDNVGVKAFRSAYIMLWLSVAESIKRKFQELASRDNTANKIVGEIAKKEAAHQSVDLYLLEQAKAYGFISDSEFQKLEHIYNLRCIFGHPYEEQPKIEALVAAASDAIEFVLSKPLQLRHSYLSQQVKQLTENHAFLDDVKLPVEKFAAVVFEKADPTLNLWFLQKIWSELEGTFSDASLEIYRKRGIWFSRTYLTLGTDTIFLSWDVVTDLTRYGQILSRILAENNLFNMLSEHPKGIIFNTLLKAAETSYSAAKRLELLHDDNYLTDHQNERFIGLLNTLSSKYLASAGLHPKYFITKIIAQLKSRDWYTQNPAIQLIKKIGAEKINILPDGDQIRLGNNILQAANGGATQCILFIREIATNRSSWSTSLIEGIVGECLFSEERKSIRIKTSCLVDALKLLGAVSEEESKKIILSLLKKLNDCTDISVRSAVRDDVVQAISSLTLLDPKYSELSALREFFNDAKFDEVDTEGENTTLEE